MNSRQQTGPKPDSPPVEAGFDYFWRYAAARQQIYWRQLAGQPPPWTDNPILAHWRFTNVYRATDRVSQYLINQVQSGRWNWPDTFARTLLFKCFNRIETWQSIVAQLGEPNRDRLSDPRLGRLLGQLASSGPIYNAAYIMPPPRLYPGAKYQRHLNLIRDMVASDTPARIEQAPSLETAFMALRNWPSIGDFLAYQWVIDLNYSPHLNFDENEFVVAGPGACRGLGKCFGPNSGWTDAELIRWTTDRQDLEFTARGLAWRPLEGRPLQLIDIQNIFCEVDKYTRLAQPGLTPAGAGQRPKQIYRPASQPRTAAFPTKWRVTIELDIAQPA